MIADIVQTGLASWWAPALAFAAGLVSCLSPCVWPLLPGYVSFITGERIVGEESGVDRRPLAPMLLFILGFTIVFVLLGAFSSTFVQVFKGTTGQRVGGAIVIAFGVLMIGYALRREARWRSTPSAGRSSLACGRAASARCRSAWPSPRAGPPASARCSGRSS